MNTPREQKIKGTFYKSPSYKSIKQNNLKLYGHLSFSPNHLPLYSKDTIQYKNKETNMLYIKNAIQTADEIKKSKSLDKRVKKIENEANCCLAFNIIKMLSFLTELQESIVNHNNDVKEKKKQFEVMKIKVKKQAQGILNGDFLWSYNINNYDYNLIKQALEESKTKSTIITKKDETIKELQIKIESLIKENNKYKEEIDKYKSFNTNAIDQSSIVKTLKSENSSLKLQILSKDNVFQDLMYSNNIKNELYKVKSENGIFSESLSPIKKLENFDISKKNFMNSNNNKRESNKNYKQYEDKLKVFQRQLEDKESLIASITKENIENNVEKNNKENNSINNGLILNQKSSEINQLIKQNKYYLSKITSLKEENSLLMRSAKVNSELQHNLSNQVSQLNKILISSKEEIGKLNERVMELEGNTHLNINDIDGREHIKKLEENLKDERENYQRAMEIIEQSKKDILIKDQDNKNKEDIINELNVKTTKYQTDIQELKKYISSLEQNKIHLNDNKETI